jgi:hypothetical protein
MTAAETLAALQSRIAARLAATNALGEVRSIIQDYTGKGEGQEGAVLEQLVDFIHAQGLLRKGCVASLHQLIGQAKDSICLMHDIPAVTVQQGRSRFWRGRQ